MGAVLEEKMLGKHFLGGAKSDLQLIGYIAACWG